MAVPRCQPPTWRAQNRLAVRVRRRGGDRQGAHGRADGGRRTRNGIVFVDWAFAARQTFRAAVASTPGVADAPQAPCCCATVPLLCGVQPTRRCSRTIGHGRPRASGERVRDHRAACDAGRAASSLPAAASCSDGDVGARGRTHRSLRRRHAGGRVEPSRRDERPASVDPQSRRPSCSSHCSPWPGLLGFQHEPDPDVGHPCHRDGHPPACPGAAPMETEVARIVAEIRCPPSATWHIYQGAGYHLRPCRPSVPPGKRTRPLSMTSRCRDAGPRSDLPATARPGGHPAEDVGRADPDLRSRHRPDDDRPLSLVCRRHGRQACWGAWRRRGVNRYRRRHPRGARRAGTREADGARRRRQPTSPPAAPPSTREASAAADPTARTVGAHHPTLQSAPGQGAWKSRPPDGRALRLDQGQVYDTVADRARPPAGTTSRWSASRSCAARRRRVEVAPTASAPSWPK